MRGVVVFRRPTLAVSESNALALRCFRIHPTTITGAEHLWSQPTHCVSVNVGSPWSRHWGFGDLVGSVFALRVSAFSFAVLLGNRGLGGAVVGLQGLEISTFGLLLLGVSGTLPGRAAGPQIH